MLQTKVVGKIRTFYVQNIVPVMRYCGKYIQTGHR